MRICLLDAYEGVGAYLRFLKVAVLAVIAIVTTLPSDS